MPESHDWLDAGGFKSCGHVGISPKGSVIDLAWTGFDSSPLQAETIMADSQLFQCAEIFFEFAPRKRGFVTAYGRGTFSGEFIPVGFEIIGRAGPGIAIFCLVRGGGNSPPEGSDSGSGMGLSGRRRDDGRVCHATDKQD